MKLVNIISLTITALFLLVSCNNSRVFNNYKNIDKQAWNKDSVISFTFNTEDTINHYNVLLNIRHNSEFKFQNLWLFTISTDPKGNVAKDTLECYLYNNIGKPLGQDYFYVYEMPLIYMNNIKFPTQGEYKFEIKQAMRDSLLIGIESLGLTIEKVDYGKE
jgi:gliding motility-associated lipoprotein GldH